jgi:ribonuclease HI
MTSPLASRYTLHFDACLLGQQAVGSFLIEGPFLSQPLTGVCQYRACSINEAELLAAVRGLLVLTGSFVSVFGDNTAAIRGLSQPGTLRSITTGQVSRQIRRVFGMFQGFAAFHVQREANWQAHNLIENTLVEKGGLNGIPKWRFHLGDTDRGNRRAPGNHL